LATLTLRPNAAGDKTNIPSVSGATYHYEACGDNSDSTYVYQGAASATTIDLFHIPNHTSETAVISKVTIYIRGVIVPTEATDAKYRSVIKTGGTEYVGLAWGNSESISTASADYTTNPYTTSAWTWDDIDALQIGGNCFCSDSYAAVRIHDVWLIVTYEDPVTITPTTLALTITAYAPVLQIVITPSTLVITITTYASVLKEVVTPTTLALTTTSYIPVLNFTHTPTTLSLIIITYAPGYWSIDDAHLTTTITTPLVIISSIAHPLSVVSIVASGTGVVSTPDDPLVITSVISTPLIITSSLAEA
jgi:hypothetical protein